MIDISARIWIKIRTELLVRFHPTTTLFVNESIRDEQIVVLNFSKTSFEIIWFKRLSKCMFNKRHQLQFEWCWWHQYVVDFKLMTVLRPVIKFSVFDIHEGRWFYLFNLSNHVILKLQVLIVWVIFEHVVLFS